MKPLMIFAIALFTFAGCKSNKDSQSERDIMYLTDTSGYNVIADTPAVAEPVVVAPAPPPRTTRTTRSTSSNTGNTITPAPTSTGTSSSGSGTVAEVPAENQKEGWSKAAKGAVIGGVAGAATGAVISKSGKGAIIGGVIGAGGGYIIGRSKDKKDGRVKN